IQLPELEIDKIQFTEMSKNFNETLDNLQKTAVPKVLDYPVYNFANYITGSVIALYILVLADLCFRFYLYYKQKRRKIYNKAINVISTLDPKEKYRKAVKDMYESNYVANLGSNESISSPAVIAALTTEVVLQKHS